MSTIMSCPHCNGQITVTPELHGMEVTCPHCQRTMSIPGLPQAPIPQQTSYGGRQYQPPRYGAGPGGYGQTPVHVPDYLVLSILVTFFCCLVGGVIGIIYSVNANSKKNSGDYRGALRDANTAKTWCTVSIVIGVVSIFVSLAIFAAGARGGGF